MAAWVSKSGNSTSGYYASGYASGISAPIIEEITPLAIESTTGFPADATELIIETLKAAVKLGLILLSTSVGDYPAPNESPPSQKELFSGIVGSAYVYSRPLKSAPQLKGMKAARHHFVIVNVSTNKGKKWRAVAMEYDVSGKVSTFHCQNSFNNGVTRLVNDGIWKRECNPYDNELIAYNKSVSNGGISLSVLYGWASKFAMEETYDVQRVNCVAFARYSTSIICTHKLVEDYMECTLETFFST